MKSKWVPPFIVPSSNPTVSIDSHIPSSSTHNRPDLSVSSRSKSRTHKLIQMINFVSLLVNASICCLLCATSAEDSGKLLLQPLDPIFEFLVATLKLVLTSLDLG